MSLHIHKLAGCRPAPLAHYLKALGILRIISEQADPTARGWWQDEQFCLLTTMDAESLEDFFADEYAPTPFVSPWNKGSGFYKDNDPGLAPIEQSTCERLAAFREGIAAGRKPLQAISEADAKIRQLNSTSGF